MNELKPVNVLCLFRGWYQERGSSLSFYDSIMITVEKSSDINRKFHSEMNRRYYQDARHFRVGPIPRAFELVSYITENGKPVFNIFKDK